MTLLAQNINLFESCLTLLDNNMEQDAYILARCQFNNTLWINYLCSDVDNERTKEYYYEFHITQLLQLRNIKKYVRDNDYLIRNSGANTIEKGEVNTKIKSIENILKEEGYDVKKVYSKSLAQLSKERSELFGIYISMYCESSKYEHSSRGVIDKYRRKILDDYSEDMAFKLDLGSSDFELWKQVFNFSLLSLFLH